MHRGGDGEAIGRKSIARSESVFDLNRRVTLQANLAGKMQRGALAVERILGQAVKGGNGDEKRGELRMIDEFEVEFLFPDSALGRIVPGDEKCKIERDHRGRSAEFAGHSSEMIAGDRADGAADIDDLRRSEIGGKCSDDAAAGHGNCYVAKVHKRMATEIDAVGFDRGDGARGIDGGVALDQNHASHVARHEMRILRSRCRCAALRRDEAIGLKLIRELLNRGGLKTRENQRSLDALEGGAERQAGARVGFGGQRKLLNIGLRRRALQRRIQHIGNGCDAGDGLLGEYSEFQGERTRQFAIEIDGAAAHTCHHPGVLHFGALELDKDDSLLRTEKILQHADDFKVKFFDLVALEDGVGVALHAGMDPAQGKEFIGLRNGCETSRQADGSREGEDSAEERATIVQQLTPILDHEPPMIRGGVSRSNPTPRG